MFVYIITYVTVDIDEHSSNQYFRCEGLILLETYTTAKGEDLKLPSFLDIAKEVTDDTGYSMYNLSKRDVGSPKIEELLIEPEKDDDVTKNDTTKTTSSTVVNGTT